MKQLPAALADPIAVFGSDSVAVFGSDSVAGRLVFMVDVTDANGATVVLPVQLDAKKNKDTALIHIVTSAYSKEKKGVPNNSWFEIQAKNLLYLNRKKEERWVVASGSNSLWDVSNALGKKIYSPRLTLSRKGKRFPVIISRQNVQNPAPA